MKIGEAAARVGTTPRTIRYYEEIGLLPGSDERPSGGHRIYDERDIERLQDALRLKELLGLSLEELKTVLEAEEGRAALRAEWHRGDASAQRQREILDEALGHLDRQQALVKRRRQEIDALEDELEARRRRVRSRLKRL